MRGGVCWSGASRQLSWDWGQVFVEHGIGGEAARGSAHDHLARESGGGIETNVASRRNRRRRGKQDFDMMTISMALVAKP